MVELTVAMVLDVIRTTGILIGIIYYLVIMRNNQRTRQIDMVTQRAEQARNYDFQKMARQISPMYLGNWSTPEEYYELYNFYKTPELELSRVILQNSLNTWGFLFREGVIDANFVDRLYSPWHIISYWENFKPLMLAERETAGNPEAFKDLEYLYDAMKKKYPHLSNDTEFWFTKMKYE